MQITPTGGAAGTGVSEAKLTPTPGLEGPAGGGHGHLKGVSSPVLSDSVMVRELAVSDLIKLTQILQPTAQPGRAAQVDNLVNQAVRAITEGRLEYAVGRVIEAAIADPSRVEELRTKPELEPIQSGVENLLVRLTNVAKMDAETRLTSAEQLIENSGVTKLPTWETSPTALVHLGHRLIEAGGYANYIRTAELAAALQAAYATEVMVPPTPATAEARRVQKNEDGGRRKDKRALAASGSIGWSEIRGKVQPRAARLWSRAPLLVLLVSWFAVGFVAGVGSRIIKLLSPNSWVVSASDFGFQIWGIGFLALVLFGFWARVRSSRR